MAKGKKSGGRDWEPGESGNPKGPAVLPPDIREARKLNKQEFERIVNKFLYLTPAEIKAIAEDPKTPAFELMIGAIVAKAVTQADTFRAEFLIARLVPKLPEKITVDGSLHSQLVGLIQELEHGPGKNKK